ncbi:hypothetical protein EG68_00739 [Paragonimus skrjabini miyazakii]|uniref:Glycosyl hydrolase family 13 catalytic domain-containing protein n=1 Tax=Paragonimus skrjabini miyazakii TaxID=59628 RepID=A0A8S9Z8U2_9TREM|nr:hypothetical protein EG68_00739 [Paragonimus skrjabini miyazakii]
MTQYRYTQGRPSEQRDSYSEQPEYEGALSPELAGYVDNSYAQGDHSVDSNAMFYDPSSPFFGMDPQLVGFMQKHNVVMDDGAVLNINAMKEKAAMEQKPKKQFQPPCGFTRCQFISIVVLSILFVILLIVALTTGLVLGLRVIRPSYPRAQPWWRRTQMYYINVATWANDVGGPTGRLADVIPRMTYLSVQIGATSIVLTELLASDVNGVSNWTQVNSQVAAPDEAISSLLPRLVSQSKQPRGPLQKGDPIHILLGMSLYATSDRHTWFQQSKLASMTRFSTFYIWRTDPPVTPQELRYFAFDETRKAYYRHVHGNPNSPLLNLTDPQVQTELKNVIQFWRQHLNIEGVVIINSTNVIPTMIPAIRTILNQPSDQKFIWFADDPRTDATLNLGERVCFFTININRRVPTRADDLTAQIVTAMNDTRLVTCSPIWKVTQLSDDNKDYQTVQQIAHFLPGAFLMMAGQEVDISSGNTDLIQWSYKQFNDFSTYWPTNKLFSDDGFDRLQQWRKYWMASSAVSLLATGINTGRLMVIQPRLNENVLTIYRVHRDTRDRVYFVVSFETLNTVVQFSSIFFDLTTPTVEVSYDSKGTYSGRRKFGATTLVNNEVLLLHYF